MHRTSTRSVSDREIFLKRIADSCDTCAIPRVDEGIGSILTMLAALIDARRVLEVGTGSGYSAVSIASRLRPGFEISTLEKDAHVYRIAKKNIRQSPYARSIRCHHTDAIAWLKRTNAIYDFIFVDGKKREYETYLDLCVNKLRSGGLIVFDDTFFTPHERNGKRTAKAIYGILLEKRLVRYFEDFNAKFSRDPRFESYFVHVSHGLTVGMKR
jgi:caffeoyl-CoA O-methyltransferase